MILDHADVRAFVRESNRIEGIHRPPLKRELDAHVRLLSLNVVTIGELAHFVMQVQPGKRLRNEPGMNVRVGNHIAPPGGPMVERDLYEILDAAQDGEDPYLIHQRYEHLHPFMDGNGRSGRAVWLWQMLNQRNADYALRMGFLHLFYYQGLSAWRFPAESPPLGPEPVLATDALTVQAEQETAQEADRHE